jgi:hypothetical protein
MIAAGVASHALPFRNSSGSLAKLAAIRRAAICLVMRIPVMPVVPVSVAVVVDRAAASSAARHRVFAARSGTVLRYR